MRPIILLAPLRKILIKSLINSCWGRMKKHITLSQAAYQSGRSTTEQVFAIKTLGVKAITSENYDIFLLLLDMSKVFHIVDRKKLINILGSILTKCELHTMYVLINDVILNETRLVQTSAQTSEYLKMTAYWLSCLSCILRF